MKNKTILTVIIFLSYFAYSQEKNSKILVEYTSTEGTIKNKEKLIVAQNVAIYITDSLFIENKQNTTILKTEKGTNTIIIRPKIIKFNANIYYHKLGSSIVYFDKEMNGKFYTIKDSLPKLDWKIISGETKKINNFTCNKATLNYRGSKLIAYYTTEIPIPFGPWKFKGLPGLILEVYSVSGDILHHWIANQIVYPFESNKRINFTVGKEKKIVGLNIYIEYMENKIKNLMKISSSRVPKGVKITSTKLNRAGIEKVYEWEQ